MCTSRFRLCFLILLALAAPSSGHETDQFNSPPGRSFADLGEYLNRWVYDVIERGRAVTNATIRDAIDRHEPGYVVEQLQSPERLTLAIRQQWPWSVSQIEGFERILASPKMQERYPGKLVAYADRVNGIYHFAFLPFDIRGWSHLAFFSSTIKVYGVYLGTDKLGHFTDEGINYYYTYLAARQSGASERAAVAAAVRTGTNGIMSEGGMLGMLGTADYSNADLAANFAGFLFYRNLTESLRIQGKLCDPMLVRQGDYWITAPDVGPETPFFARFISDHLDEALNPGYFDLYLRPTLRRAVARRSEALLQRYATDSGDFRSRAWFDSKLAELSSFNGTDYGHRGGYGDLVSIGSCCFGEQRGEQVAAAPLRHVSAKVLSALPAADLSREGRTGRPVALVSSLAPHPNRSLRSAPDAFGRGPLHDAAQRATPGDVEALLNDGADSRAVDDYGTTPLHLACRRGSVAIARLLLDHGADPNAANQSGTTPLHEAASSGDLAVVKLLIERGANPQVHDSRNQTPAQVATSDGFPTLSQALISLRAQ